MTPLTTGTDNLLRAARVFASCNSSMSEEEGAEYVAQRAIRAALQANPGAVGRLRDVLLGEDVG